jgi:hypothetical protein
MAEISAVVAKTQTNRTSSVPLRCPLPHDRRSVDNGMSEEQETDWEQSSIVRNKQLRL